MYQEYTNKNPKLGRHVCGLPISSMRDCVAGPHTLYASSEFGAVKSESDPFHCREAGAHVNDRRPRRRKEAPRLSPGRWAGDRQARGSLSGPLRT